MSLLQKIYVKVAAYLDIQKHRARLRQLSGVLASVYGVLTATIPGLHLKPSWISAILVGSGPLILVVEQWLDDPSTGNTVKVITAAEADVNALRGKAPVPPVAAAAASTAPLPPAK